MTPTGLRTRILGRHWEHFDALGSTNDYLKERADSLPDGAAVTAALQTEGKGRLGRRWTSGRGAGLALSLLLRDWPVADLQPLPLVVGVAVAQGLEDVGAAECQVKWSNDVLLGGQKICGILCESKIQGSWSAAILGIGVNLTQTREELDHHDLVYATSLHLATGIEVGREETAVALVNRLEPLLARYRAEGFAGIREEYRARCATLHKPVRVIWRERERLGYALDIGPDGALRCDFDGEQADVYAGEVSVRGLGGYT